MRRDGLRIDPTARPYGMEWLEILAEQVSGSTITFSPDDLPGRRWPLNPAQKQLIDALGVTVIIGSHA